MMLKGYSIIKVIFSNIVALESQSIPIIVSLSSLSEFESESPWSRSSVVSLLYENEIDEPINDCSRSLLMIGRPAFSSSSGGAGY